MTERQKKALGKARDVALSMIDPVQIKVRVEHHVACGSRILRALDAIEADGKCRRISVGGPDEVCSGCGHEFENESKQAGTEKHCPGCGREIEAKE